jgi:hypothetical protein
MVVEGPGRPGGDIVRGLARVAADFALLAAVNLGRLGMLGVACHNGAWTASQLITGNGITSTGHRLPAASQGDTRPGGAPEGSDPRSPRHMTPHATPKRAEAGQ